MNMKLSSETVLSETPQTLACDLWIAIVNNFETALTATTSVAQVASRIRFVDWAGVSRQSFQQEAF